MGSWSWSRWEWSCWSYSTVARSGPSDPGLPSAFLPPCFLCGCWSVAGRAVPVGPPGGLVDSGAAGRRAGESGEPARFPDLESAWEEIQIRLSHAHYDAGQQKVFLLLPTEESMAGVDDPGRRAPVLAQAPADENAPIHAYATADGLFISCAGASAWGGAMRRGPPGWSSVCRRILAAQPRAAGAPRSWRCSTRWRRPPPPEMLQRSGRCATTSRPSAPS